MTHYDVIILGVGGVGSAAAFHAARRGAKVLGIDRFPGGHDRGSSHGETRIIRQAYFEHADYVPLLMRAYELWRELEQISGEYLLQQIGLLQVGPPEGVVVRGVLAAASQHGLSIQSLSAADVHRRFPGFRVSDGSVGVFEPAAGYLNVERCVLSHLAAARLHGAEFRFGAGVRSRHSKGGDVIVETEEGESFHGSQLIITAGPWAPTLLADLGVALTVRRKHSYWYPKAEACYQEARGCPAFLYELPQGVYYGLPQIDSLGVKVAEHSGGTVVEDPLNDPRELDLADLMRLEAFLSQHVPGVSRQLGRRSVCFYTMSPDEHFIVDQSPHEPNVFFAAGLSGHGFKFTSVLGEALAGLALEVGTDLPVGFLSVARFER